MKRYLLKQILIDLKKKMVFITGPRQVGKTYLAMQVAKYFKNSVYLNFDNIDHHRIVYNRSWPINTDLLIFDEIHKMKKWKIYLKGIFDTISEDQSILVTGSSKLDTFRKGGDSLAGRYLHLRLNPLSVKELSGIDSPYEIINKLNTLGGFPEPFLSSSINEAARWRNQYFTDLIREDVMDFSRIDEIRIMKLLLDLLRWRVGSPLSYSSLAEDLKISPNTVKRYISILESLYIIFIIRPFHKNIARTVTRIPKLYFYDSGYVKGDIGKILENTCAVSLLKNVQYLYDVLGRNIELNYLKTRDGKEIDFLITEDNIPKYFIEVKVSDRHTSRFLRSILKRFPKIQGYQLVHNLKDEEHIDGINIVPAGKFLSQLDA